MVEGGEPQEVVHWVVVGDEAGAFAVQFCVARGNLDVGFVAAPYNMCNDVLRSLLPDLLSTELLQHIF